MADKSGKPVPKVAAPVSMEHVCKSCGAGLVARVRPKNRQEKVDHRWWGCSAFPKCKQAYDDLNGKPNFSTGKQPKPA